MHNDGKVVAQRDLLRITFQAMELLESYYNGGYPVGSLATAVFRLVVQKSRRESAHARPFGGDFEHARILVVIFGQPT